MTTTTPAQAVEIALRGVSLSEAEAERLRRLIAVRTRPASARDRLDAHLDTARGQWLRDARRLVREALAEQAAHAVNVANDAQLSGADGYEVALAVKQALLTDDRGE